MQIVQTLNDFIKILYTPSLENLCLGDFLLIQEAQQRFLGQVIEISDDRFDDSKNLAQIKLTHSINEKGEIIDFNNHLPSKQCDILYANKREIIDFVNENRKIVTLGQDFKFPKPFEINIDFFRNNSLVFCDKIKEHNSISSTLAKKLSQFRNSIIFDYTGSLEIEGAQRFLATLDFKLPLDFHSLDYIWEKGLSTASLETQAICEEIFNEVKNYSRIAKDKFIPFNQFVKVVASQHKATPIRELMVLKNRLQKYQQEEIFANSKSDFSNIFENLGKEKITIIDLSRLKTFWHKDFTEFILRSIGISSFVFLRLNETNFDYNLLQLLYKKNKKYTPIPSVSESFAKLPAIMEFCHNYVILPTNLAKRDFGHINNTINSMSENSALLFGQDTKNFAFLIKNINKDFIEEKTTKQPAKVTFEGDVIKNMRVKDKLTQLNRKKMREIEQDVDKFLSSSIKLPPQPPKEPEIIEEFVPSIQENIVEPQSIEPEAPTPNTTTHFQIEEIISEEELDLIDALDLNNINEPIYPEEEIIENFEQEAPKAEIATELVDELTDEFTDEISTETNYETPQEEILENEIQKEETQEEEILEENFANVESTQENFIDGIGAIEESGQTETIEEFSLEDLATESIESTFEQMVDETDDTIELAEEVDETSEIENEIEATVEDVIEETTAEELEEDFLNPQEADFEATSVEQLPEFEEVEKEMATPPAAFEQLPAAEVNIFEKPLAKKVEISTPVKAEKKAEPVFSKEFIEEIPLFAQEKIEPDVNIKYQEGDSVTHEKYGNGKVLQVVEYADKVLLQIEFKQIGKRLLDPIAANLIKN